jgi:hypothetical protein
MNTIKSLIISSATITLLSCGPSAETIKQETKEATEHNMEIKVSLQDSIKTIEALKIKCQKAFSDSKAQLEVEKDKLARIEEWKFGRTESERENQIKNQTRVVNDLSDYIIELENSIPKADEKIKQLREELEIVEIQLQ